MQPGSLSITSELNITKTTLCGADLGWHMPGRMVRSEGTAVYNGGLDQIAWVGFEQSLNKLIRSQGMAEEAV